MGTALTSRGVAPVTWNCTSALTGRIGGLEHPEQLCLIPLLGAISSTQPARMQQRYISRYIGIGVHARKSRVSFASDTDTGFWQGDQSYSDILKLLGGETSPRAG